MDAHRINEIRLGEELQKVELITSMIKEATDNGYMTLELNKDEVTQLQKDFLLEKGYVIKELTHKVRISWHNLSQLS